MNRLTAIAMTATLLATLAPAQAGMYCSGLFETAGFYSQVQGNGTSSVVSYWMILQNRTANPQPYTVRFTALLATAAQSGRVIATALKYQTVTLKLGQHQFANPSGKGALDNADVARYTQVQCPPAP